jgi:penicillin-binding protein 2
VIGGYSHGRLGAGDEPRVEGRLFVLAGAIVLAFAIFLVRLFQLQIVEGADLAHRSERNSVRTVRLEAPRGEIVDREGRVLATARPAFRVGVIPSDVRAPGLTARALGLLLDRDPQAVRQLITAPRGRERFQPVVVERDLSHDALARVESHRYALAGVVTSLRPLRLYVQHELAAHLLGTIGEVQAEQLESGAFSDYQPGDVVGQRGLEARLEQHLRGRDGGRNIVVDVAGREIELIDEVDPVPGGRVVLTLDLDLQRAAADAFRAPPPEDPEAEPEPDLMGALVALDPRNGDVLALVSRPAYDPNDFADGIGAEKWSQLTSDPWRPLQDRALSGQYPPGSTYKPIVAAAGLAEGVLDPDEKVFCPGYYRLGRRVYRCWRRGGHGEVDLHDALKESCDVYFYKLGVELGIDRIARIARGFGLGEPTGIELPGEKTGLVPSRKWKERARGEPWIKGETVSAAIGQGYNLVTPLQLAVAYAAIANGGTRVTPRVVKRRERWTGQLVAERPVEARGKVPVAPAHLARIREGLTAVVMDRHGTGGRARVPGVVVAGKTGTSQVVRLEHVEGLEDDEIPLRYRDHALFAAFAPAEDPEIVVVAVVEHSGSGGSVAAPIVQKVLARYFEKRRERAPEAEILTAHAHTGEGEEDVAAD